MGRWVPLAVLGVIAIAAITLACLFCEWSAAATLLVGFSGATVVWWQGTLIKRQMAFQAFIEFDKEWNSAAMLELRKNVWADDADRFNISRLEGILELFEKLASFRAAGVLDAELVVDSTLGWYAIRYCLFARDEIRELRQRWEDDQLYVNLEALYDEYVGHEVARLQQDRETWERCQSAKKGDFFRQEAKD